uniref:UDP-glucuronosyltransferase n=1 Tax=Panagrellus redivivus TaxID=6233 RepID=A0A7E4VU06_PANRE
MDADIDLVIVDEIFTMHGMLIADKLYKEKGIPYAIFGTSHLIPDWHAFTLALGHNPVLNPLHGSYIPTNTGEFFDPSSFTHRLRNVIDSGREVSRQEYVFRNHRSPTNFEHETFCVHNFMKKASLYFRESLDRHRVVPVSADWRPAGAHCSKRTPPVLTGELKEFVEDPNSNGTIYIAFGTIIDFGTCPESIFNAFFETLNELPDYRIVMAMRTMKNRTLPHLKNHVKIVPWAPQPSILTHNKTRLFLTHGGLKSVKEALCTETPVLVMPIFAEQGVSATLALKYGFGRALNKLMFSKNDFLRELREFVDSAKPEVPGKYKSPQNVATRSNCA